MIPVTTSKKITGDTMGRLTCRNFANPLAPSRSAAS